MLAFLIITGLSLAFYLGLLVVLHRDGRKRRIGASPIRKVRLGTVAEFSAVGPASTASIPFGRRGRSPAFVGLTGTSRRQAGNFRTNTGGPIEVITLPRLAHSKNDQECS